MYEIYNSYNKSIIYRQGEPHIFIRKKNLSYRKVFVLHDHAMRDSKKANLFPFEVNIPCKTDFIDHLTSQALAARQDEISSKKYINTKKAPFCFNNCLKSCSHAGNRSAEFLGRFGTPSSIIALISTFNGIRLPFSTSRYRA